MIVNDPKLMVVPKGVRWIATPAKQRDRSDGSGKAVWDDFIEFNSKTTRDRFQEQILELLRCEHPEAFAGEPDR